MLSHFLRRFAGSSLTSRRVLPVLLSLPDVSGKEYDVGSRLNADAGLWEKPGYRRGRELRVVVPMEMFSQILKRFRRRSLTSSGVFPVPLSLSAVVFQVITFEGRIT